MTYSMAYTVSLWVLDAVGESVCRCGARFTGGDGGEVTAGAPDGFSVVPGCWALYGEVLARYDRYEEFRLYAQLVVDAYALQHVRVVEDESSALHLMTLQLFMDGLRAPVEGSRLHQRMAHRVKDWAQLRVPERVVTVGSVVDVAQAQDQSEAACAAWRWAGEVWDAWGDAHGLVRSWNERLALVG